MNIETASANVRTMGKAVKYATITGKQTKVFVESGVLSEGSISAAEAPPEKR